MMRRVVVASLGVVALAASASAGERYGSGFGSPGFYVGVNGGYAFSAGENRVTLGDGNPFSPFGPSIPGVEPEGGFGGGQVGYNFGSLGFGPGFVFGIEADIQGSDISDDVSYGAQAGTASRRSTLDINYFGTVRGRIGYAFDRTLVYATGGFAYGNVDYTILNLAGQTLYKKDGVETGYVLGGGLEHKFAPNWSLKLEYQYINLGDTNLNNIGNGLTSTTARSNDVTTDFHTVRIGLNYAFGGRSYEPMK
jgi:outer membrane immunogenic protein